MFEYFDGNYTWNMAVNLALGMGASAGDLDDACRSLRALARNRDDAAAEQWFDAWHAVGARLRRMAQLDESRGRRLSAAAKYRRAAIQFVQAERMQSAHFAGRAPAYAAMLECFGKYLSLAGESCERVEVPYEGTTLPSLFVPAQRGDNAQGPAPCMIHFDGLDVNKEILFMLGMPQAMARRGVSTLVVDNPGVGESLRLRGLHNGPTPERPAAAALDWLGTRREVDPKRTGIMALSLGGFHAPRAAAFEPRLACCVAWGAQYDWGVVQRARAQDAASSLPVPHYWDHVGWVFGVQGMDAILDVSSKISLVGILDRIRCPILVVHGENDRQIPLANARRVIEECVNSPKRELYIHTLADGGAEHCSIDNVPLTCEVISDWVAETLAA